MYLSLTDGIVMIVLANILRLQHFECVEFKKGVGLSSNSSSTFQCGDIEVLLGIDWYYDWSAVNR